MSILIQNINAQPAIQSEIPWNEKAAMIAIIAVGILVVGREVYAKYFPQPRRILHVIIYNSPPIKSRNFRSPASRSPCHIS